MKTLETESLLLLRQLRTAGLTSCRGAFLSELGTCAPGTKPQRHVQNEIGIWGEKSASGAHPIPIPFWKTGGPSL